MGIISWIVFGLLAGAAAKFIMPGKDPGGCLLTIGLGVVGAVVGGFLATRLGFGTVTGFNVTSFLIAIGGSLLILLAYRLIKKS